MKRSPDTRQISLLPPDAAALLHLVRENLRLLEELATRYEVPRLDARPEGQQVRSPADLASYLAPELVYQGGINATAIRLADCFREAVARGAAAVIFAHNHPSGAPRGA